MFLKQDLKKQKVIVAMSGGVDSSVAAALLKKADFEVIGIFMNFWKDLDVKGAWNRCCSPEAEKRARKVAAKIGIPFYVLNLEQEFKKKVVDYFLAEYRTARTPNPCVVCNKEIKFGLLLEKALSLGADFVATGHYAKKEPSELKKALKLEKVSELNFSALSEKFNYRLLKAKDKERDQSYFLWMLNQKQLRHILFPLGDLRKKEVRNLAKKFELLLSGIPESREICFITTTVNDFLKKHLKQTPGKIVDTKGNELGKHQGLAFYTIGQRRGLAISGGPYWVLDKDLKKNLLIITNNEKDLYQKELITENVNWISPKQSLLDALGQVGKEPKLPLKVKVKIRYKHKEVTATITKKLRGRTYKVVFSKAQKAITPGQSVVFYKGEELLGGGVIKS